MPTSLLTDTLRAKHAAVLIAALVTSLALESRSAESKPPNSDLYFNDYAGIACKEPPYHFNQTIARVEPSTGKRLKDRIDSSGDSAFTSGVLRVRFEDKGPGQILPEDHRGGPPVKPITATVSSTASQPQERQSATPKGTNPVATETRKPVPDKDRGGRDWTPWLLIIPGIAAPVVISRVLRRRRRDNSYKPPIYPIRIAIKFKTNAGQPPQHLDGWQALLGRRAKHLAPLRIFPLFESLDPRSLGELIDSALANDPSYKPPDLLAWFQVETPLGLNAHELLKPLRKLDKVETAYLMRPVPPPVAAADDPLNPLQGYEDAAPDGIDARYAWGLTGGDGAGIGFVDLETGWDLDHQDLRDANITIISGRNRRDRIHGTSVLGQVLMVDNGRGGVGIAPSAQGRVISQQRTRSSYNTPDAIADAATKMVFGDVLLLEAQEFNPNGVEGDETVWPVEIADASYEAISIATAKGIVVVEAGANGGQDLDSYKNAAGQKIFDRNSAGFRDSGAIMVGAASSAHPHVKLEFSNYGNRIDCYGWGENIQTTTTNLAGTRNTMYRGDFKGTSGASPMIAGAALILQGIRQAALDRGIVGKRFSPRELRDFLTANGTPSNTPETDKIGVMPDLRAIINNLRELYPTSAPS